MAPITLPSELWPLRDAVIGHVRAGMPLPANSESLLDWYTDESNVSLEDTWQNEDMVLHWPSVVEPLCSDEELRKWEGLAPLARITDAMRCAYAEARFEPLRLGHNERDVHSVHLVTLLAADASTAVLGWTAECRGQGGFEATNRRVCRDRQEYAEWLRARGFLNPSESTSPEILLKVWRRSRPRKSAE